MFGSSRGTDELRCYVDLDKNLFVGVSASSINREKYFLFECVFFSSHGKNLNYIQNVHVTGAVI